MPDQTNQPTFQWSAEQKLALSKVWTLEKRKEMAEKQVAYWATRKGPMSGKTHTKESKLKMRNAQLRNWATINALKEKASKEEVGS